MCIRDSNSTYAFSENRLNDGIELEGLEFHNIIPQEAYRACLLYTSDAADERSSVDLGGRRIIKKKKYEDQPWRREDHNKTNTLE